MSKKPRNLKRVKIDDKDIYGLAPYVCWSSGIDPTWVTLDGQFGIQDLEWIIKRMKAKEPRRAERSNDA